MPTITAIGNVDFIDAVYDYLQRHRQWSLGAINRSTGSQNYIIWQGTVDTESAKILDAAHDYGLMVEAEQAEFRRRAVLSREMELSCF